jgi:D-beta-D-heptose 7-phosphate kinase/D-beta-D-heptose 1-phosphate adenosyltransferase
MPEIIVHPNTKIISSLSELRSRCDKAKSKGKQIVLTSGCFDLAHSGHLDYLWRARQYGDVFVVGINSDLFISKVKGENRPIRTATDRAFLIAGFYPVSIVAMFDQDDGDFIKAVRPDTYIASTTSHVRIFDDKCRLEALAAVGTNIIELGTKYKTISTTHIIDKVASSK